MTIPAGITLPAVVDWGDLTSLETIPAGTTGPVVHTYAGAGTYTVKLRSTANSGPTFQGDVVVS
jgi:PKD repeat protein